MAKAAEKKPSKNISIKTSQKEPNFLTPDFWQKNNPEIFADEAQLSCDVYQDKSNIVIKSTMAGVDAKKLEILVSNDLLTVRGIRENDSKISQENYYCREIYWGPFSRSIILPQEIDQKKVKATLKNGVLTIILPKKYKTASIKVKQIDD